MVGNHHHMAKKIKCQTSSSPLPRPSSLIGPCLWRFLQSAPPQIAARGRTDDLAAILSVIHDAHKFVFISVMDFLPLSEYSKPLR